MRCGGRDSLFSDEEAEVYASRMRNPARARASRMLYTNYLGVARDIFFARRYDPLSLTCPVRILFGTDDFYVPQGYLAGWEGHALDFSIELIPGCSH
jgi:pimeloyl-ACP methyl ester carboxylesterase